MVYISNLQHIIHTAKLVQTVLNDPRLFTKKHGLFSRNRSLREWHLFVKQRTLAHHIIP